VQEIRPTKLKSVMIQNWTDAVKETFTFNSHQSEQEFLFYFKNLNSIFVVIKKIIITDLVLWSVKHLKCGN
jgi:hypothetical protein